MVQDIRVVQMYFLAFFVQSRRNHTAASAIIAHFGQSYVHSIGKQIHIDVLCHLPTEIRMVHGKILHIRIGVLKRLVAIEEFFGVVGAFRIVDDVCHDVYPPCPVCLAACSLCFRWL